MRTVYFIGTLTIIAFGVAVFATVLVDGQMPDQISVLESWGRIGNLLRSVFGAYVFYEVFAGLWMGGASHSLVDSAVSYVKTGR